MAKNKNQMTKRRVQKKLRRIRRQRAASLGEKVHTKRKPPAATKEAVQGPMKPAKTHTRQMR